MPRVKGDKSGEEYDRYMNEAGTERTYTNVKTGEKLSDADFRSREGGFTEAAGNTVGGGKDLSGTMRNSSVAGSGTQRVRPADAPVIREEGPSLGQEAEKRKKKTPTAGAQAEALRRSQ